MLEFMYLQCSPTGLSKMVLEEVNDLLHLAAIIFPPPDPPIRCHLLIQKVNLLAPF